jgi:glycosyltransferase involved in cell wall biosynthesis
VKQVAVVVPGALSTRTGGFIYDRHMVAGLATRGWAVKVVELDPVEHPLAPPLGTAPAQFGTISDGSAVLVDGLAFGTMPEVVEREAWRLRFVPIVHMPLATTPGLTPGEGAWLSNLERRALKHARHVVITGQRSRAQVLAMTGWTDGAQVTRIPPGSFRPAVSAASRTKGPSVRVLSVANLTAGKGYDILLRALAPLADLGWTLTCAGNDTREPDTAARLRRLAQELGIATRVVWRGELDDAALAAAYAEADLFALATRTETYGMAVADAIAHGVPVVSTRTGEIPSIVGDAGLLAEPGDAAGLRALLTTVLSDAALRQTLHDRARTAALRLPTWDDAADAMAAVLTRVADHG